MAESEFANLAQLGLFGFGITKILLSLHKVWINGLSVGIVAAAIV